MAQGIWLDILKGLNRCFFLPAPIELSWSKIMSRMTKSALARDQQRMIYLISWRYSSMVDIFLTSCHITVWQIYPEIHTEPLVIMAEFDDQHSRVPEAVFLVGIQRNGNIALVYLTDLLILGCTMGSHRHIVYLSRIPHLCSRQRSRISI